MEPEQWTVGENAGVWVGPVVRSGKKYVAFVCGQSTDNARLIAAAPRLLEALREVAEHCRYRLRKGPDSGDKLTLNLCEAAIGLVDWEGK